LHGSVYMAAMAKAAEMGGAVGIRANGVEDISAIRKVTKLPILGINKVIDPSLKEKAAKLQSFGMGEKKNEVEEAIEAFGVFITPTFESAAEIIKAGADMVAMDATPRPRMNDEKLEDIVEKIHDEFNVPVIGDVSTVEDGIFAEECGCDGLTTALAGYTKYSRKMPEDQPDIELIRELVEKVSIPVIAEGRITNPEQACEALKAGAYAVVVGTAITRPQVITSRFVKRIKSCKV